MISVSLCMIVKDEEETLPRCLNSVADLVDELVIVDTGSTDGTPEVIRSFGGQVYQFEWIDDFAAARNYAFSQATQDYILWLDADDVLLEKDRAEFLKLKESLDPGVDSVTMAYNLSEDEFGNVTFSLRRNRLVKRERQFRWIGPVHEYLEVAGNIYNSSVSVTHRRKANRESSDRNLRIYERRQAAGEVFSPRDQYYFGNELKDHGRYRQAIRQYELFLLGNQGWIEDNITACGRLADCYHELGDEQSSFESSLRSLEYDAPRPEFCCRIGFHFLRKHKYEAAAFWYKLATEIQLPVNHMAFQQAAYTTWLPHLQLCVCYDRMGDKERAYRHNEIALEYRPNDPVMLGNREYFLKERERRDGA